MKQSLFFLIYLLVASSCNPTNNFLEEENVQKFAVSEFTDYQLIDTLEFEIDEATDPLLYPNFQFSIIDSIPYIIFLRLDNQIEIVSLDNNKDRKQASFTIEGPNAVAGTETFYLHNFDSIFYLSSSQTRKLSLHNSNGELLNKWELETNREGDWMGENTFFDFKYNAKLNEVYFWTYNGAVNHKATRDTYKIRAFNIKEGSMRELGIIPEQYKRINYYPFDHIGSFVSSRKDIMLNFYPPINRVYMSNLSSASTFHKVIEFKTNNFSSHTLPLMDEAINDSELDEELAYLVESNFIYSIISNPSEDLYYLFYRKKQPYKKLDGTTSDMSEYDFDIILLDTNLKPHGLIEIKHPFNYFSHVKFAYKDKLYISMNNPTNPNFNENKVKFAVYGRK